MVITGVLIWPSAPILWLQQKGDISLGTPGPAVAQVAQCLAAMKRSVDEAKPFDRVVIVGPVAPLPVAAPDLRPTERSSVRPVPGDSREVSAHDPLADLSPHFSLPTSMVSRLLRGFGYLLPVSAIEVGIRPMAGSAGVPVGELPALTQVREAMTSAVAEVRTVDGQTLLIVVGDGAAAHGENAPLARDDRSTTYDESVRQALEIGSPADLAQLLATPDENGPLPDRPLGLVLGSLGFWPLHLLTALDVMGPAKTYFYGAPLGVSYQVAGWSPMVAAGQRGGVAGGTSS